LPLMVINVIPADKQPITEAVVSSAVKLGADRKLGVKAAQINNATSTMARVVVIRVRAKPPKCARICSQL
jgi:type IV pilus biogenesis protein CpaD/CtpE